MYWLFLIAFALLAGFLYPLATGKLAGYIPGSVTGNRLGTALVTGGFIFLSVVIAAWVARAVFGHRRIPGITG